MNRKAIFEYLDSGERKSIHFVLDEDGMSILHNILLKYGRYVNKGNRTIFFLENIEAKEVAKLIDGELISNSAFSFNPQIIKLMKDRECWFIEEKKAIRVKRAM
ncbi:MAG: hypothetical protein KAJ15_03450 [Spirochaetes bacterium]|nr:hypothetical protein [Spirochaetota bacterium]